MTVPRATPWSSRDVLRVAALVFALYLALRFVWEIRSYTLIQQAENHLLIPLIMKEGIDAPPLLTILVQAAFAIVFGFLGLLVAVPLLGAIMVVVKMLYVQDVVGDDVPVMGSEAA